MIKSILEKHINYSILLLAFLLIIIIIYPRAGPFIEYISKDEIIFRDPDTCYHARRIIYTATHNMKPAFYDPLLAHPYGAVPVWSPLYDWISALPSFIIGLGNPQKNQILICALILTLLYGITQLIFIYLLSYKIMKNHYYAILSAFLAGISNPQIRYTSIEILDHNSMLLCLFSIGIFILYLILESNNLKSIKLYTIILSLIISALFWTWPGSFVYIGILFSISFIYCLLTKENNISTVISYAYLFASILTLPLAIINYKYSSLINAFEFVSFLSIWFLLSLSIMHYLITFISNLMQKQYKKFISIKFLILLVSFFMLCFIQIAPLLKGIKYAIATEKRVAMMLFI